MIAGIRSFGAADADKVVIEFGKPLTLITGQNGAGKTVYLVAKVITRIYSSVVSTFLGYH